MLTSLRLTPSRLLLAVALAASVTACQAYTSVSAADLPTELSFTPVLAQAPMRDTARVAGVSGSVAILGLLNQSPPCFSLASGATREGDRVIVRLTAKEAAQTCNTFAAGAFDYDVGVRGLAPGTYFVDVLHRVLFKDGRAVEERAGTRRVEVK